MFIGRIIVLSKIKIIKVHIVIELLRENLIIKKTHYSKTVEDKGNMLFLLLVDDLSFFIQTIIFYHYIGGVSH